MRFRCYFVRNRKFLFWVICCFVSTASWVRFTRIAFFCGTPTFVERERSSLKYCWSHIMGREKHWSSDEDMFLARSFVHVSHDAKTGSYQKGKVFWDRVLTQFRTFIMESTRTVVALTGRWKRMQTSVSKFCGHYQTNTSVERSGNKEDDYITDTIKLYEAEEL